MPAPFWNLGDQAAAVLKTLGITPERVTAWLGRDCRCKARQDRWNMWGQWLARWGREMPEQSKALLEQLMREE